jgi:hypothetical protein
MKWAVNFIFQKNQLYDFGNKWINCWKYNLNVPFYLHLAVCHTVEVWENFGALPIFSNQSGERVFQEIFNIKDRCIITSGLKNTGSYLSQIIERKLRVFIYDIPALREELEKILGNKLKHWYSKRKK